MKLSVAVPCGSVTTLLVGANMQMLLGKRLMCMPLMNLSEESLVDRRDRRPASYLCVCIRVVPVGRVLAPQV